MKGVGIADLKARLSAHLKSVRRGRTLTVLDRDTPVARIVPFEPARADSLEIRRATGTLRDLKLPEPPAMPTNSLDMLLADRQRR